MQIGTYIRVWKLIYTTEFRQILQDNSTGNDGKQRDSHTEKKKVQNLSDTTHKN